MQQKCPIDWGRPVPWFHAATPANSNFAFSSLGGRFILLAFIGSSHIPKIQLFLNELISAAFPWNDNHALAFAVSKDVSDLTDPLVNRAFPKRRIFHDPTLDVAKQFGLIKNLENGDTEFTPQWYIIDPTLRVYATGKVSESDRLFSLPKVHEHAMPAIQPWAPVLMVPRVLSQNFCKKLVDLYNEGTPTQSGFMVEKNGKTVGVLNSSFKRRADIIIENETIRNTLNHAIYNRLRPEILKSFQFNATRIERYIVACYSADEEGFFKAHRDNTTAGTAHRRFAVTINLNTEGFEGGELRFPEFGDRTYKAPTGGAIVFSCSLLHEALPVTKGVRYATLPFLYDEEGAKVKAQNRCKVAVME